MGKEKDDTEIFVKAPSKRLVANRRVYFKESRLSRMRRFFRIAGWRMYGVLFRSVLGFFRRLNRKIGSRISISYMRCETLEHVDLLIKVLKWIVLPASIFYVFSAFFFFGENALDSMLFGLLIFFYSNFLPDLPSIFRKKIVCDATDTSNNLPWYKKYAILIFAPLFIVVVFCGVRLAWRTTETFHNFKSLAIFEGVVFIVSFVAFGGFPLSIGDVVKIVSIPLYALTGFLTHLKVDLCI